MSTRRARIKAVAALPPRRKNADADAKTKQNVLKEGYEKGPPTPRTPRTNSGKKEETKSPLPKPDIKSPVAKTVRTPPPLIPISTTKTQIENVPSPRPETPKGPVPANTTSQIENEKLEAPQSEKVSVITTAFNSNDLVTNNLQPIPDKHPSPKVVPSPKVIDIDSQNRKDVEETSGAKCGIQSIQEPNIQNVEAKHIQNVQEIVERTIENSFKEIGVVKLVGTPSDSDREKRNDVPDGKFLIIECT